MADDGKEKKGCCQRFGDGLSNFAKFLYNGETGQVMGRSGESWLKIGIFYVIFYGFLAAFFSAMLTVFLQTLNDPETGKGPKLVQFIENKPGLTYQKKWSNIKDIKAADYKTFVNEKILSNYKDKGKGCGDSTTGMAVGEDCIFNSTLLGACGPDGEAGNFGVDEKKPCVYVRMNKVYGWVPEETEGAGNYLRLKCDKSEAEGVEVIPKGFHIGSFPFRGQKDFELPIVAVKINTELATKTVCYLDGPNIEVSESSVPHRAYAKVEIS